MEIHPEKSRSLNQGAIKVSSFLQELIEPAAIEQKANHTSSIDHLEPIVLGSVNGPFTIRTYLSSGQREVVAIREKESKGKKWVGYDETSYKDFKKFTQSLNKEAFVNQFLTAETVEEITFRWMIDAYNKKNVPEFISYLQNFIEDNIATHKIYFPIANLSIGGVFEIGQVEFIFFTKEYFDNMWHELIIQSPAYLSNKKMYEDMRKKYQGKVCASYTSKGEVNKVIEIAFERCSLAVDVLKICSRTSVIPEEILAFDIESRLTKNPMSDIIITSPYDATVFRINKEADLYPYDITVQEWEFIQDLGLDVFHGFLLRHESVKSELKSMILSSISNYAKALSKRDLHQRIIELYTILESLLLPSDGSPIQDTVTKYLPMLISKQKEKRVECSKVVRAMYNVRSKLIHHARRVDFEILDLHKLQTYVLTLLKNLVILSSKHNTKQAVLSEIDDAILSSY